MLYLDADVTTSADAGSAPALVCWRGCTRIELTADGTPLVVVQPGGQSHPVEEHIRAMSAQGTSPTRIAKRLGCNVDLVTQVLRET